ncbi:ABC transporter ATP-binding protein [Streptomyces alkaliterrae]|nr:ATP-binding cassette domain-containing protein [Streptomyces alkaliterrae]MBB1259555.1 ATP-binding cassette domain-containing protein [Streptomyces alkaliterrae]
MTLLEIDSVTKEFDGDLTVLRDVSLTVRPGELVWLRGRSGAGKTTLLSLAGLLSSPTHGTVRVDGAEVGTASRAAEVRRSRIGFVFQKPLFLPALSTVDNVMLPSPLPHSEARAAADQLLTRFDVGSRADHRPGLLSGGEAQRVALARALMNDPALVLADEPTAGLDAETAALVRTHLAELAHEQRAVVVASHDDGFADVATRSVTLRNGELTDA